MRVFFILFIFISMKKKNTYLINENQLSNLVFLDFFKKIFKKDSTDDSEDSEMLSIINQLGGFFGKPPEELKKKKIEAEKKYIQTTNKSLDFKDATELIIKRLEGGYYHPDMKKKNPAKYEKMLGSGETMFGLDRKWGPRDAEIERFWKLVDDANARTSWEHNYMLEDNPELADELISILANRLQGDFQKFSNSFTDETRRIVMSSPKLFFNFAYATWNGSRDFKNWAHQMNVLVDSGITDPEILNNEMIEMRKRTNPTLRNSSEKVRSITQTLV